MKVVVTGGHLSPAFSVIEKLPSDTEVLIIGRKHTFEGDTNLSFEYKTAVKRNIRFIPIVTGRLQRTFTRYTIPSLFKIPRGFLESYKILSDYRPNIVMSFGGYVSVPVVFAAKLLKIPVIVHEQTLGAGLANKIAGKFAETILVSWDSSRKLFPEEKTIVVGNPIREFNMSNSQFKVPKGTLPLLYITGGSSGSHTINVLVEQILDTLLDNFRIIHQTGDSWNYKDYERIEKHLAEIEKDKKERCKIIKHIDQDDVGMVLENADFVVSRAGINTITELMYFEKPALLIPLNKEQKENALFFQNLGLGTYRMQQHLTSEKLLEEIQLFYSNLKSYKKNFGTSIKQLPKDAAKKIVSFIHEKAKV